MYLSFMLYVKVLHFCCEITSLENKHIVIYFARENNLVYTSSDSHLWKWVFYDHSWNKVKILHRQDFVIFNICLLNVSIYVIKATRIERVPLVYLYQYTNTYYSDKLNYFIHVYSYGYNYRKSVCTFLVCTRTSFFLYNTEYEYFITSLEKINTL